MRLSVLTALLVALTAGNACAVSMAYAELRTVFPHAESYQPPTAAALADPAIDPPVGPEATAVNVLLKDRRWVTLGQSHKDFLVLVSALKESSRPSELLRALPADMPDNMRAGLEYLVSPPPLRADALAALSRLDSSIPARLWIDNWNRRLDYLHRLTPVMLRALDAVESQSPLDTADLQETARDLNRLMQSPHSLYLLPLRTRSETKTLLKDIWAKAGLGELPPAPRLPDSAVELEVSLTPKLLSLFTSKDGTVGGLLGARALPKGVRFYPTRGTAPSDPRKLKLRNLQAADFQWLLRYVSKFKRTDFFEDRRIPNLFVKKSIMMLVKTKVWFLGKLYEPGKRRVSLAAMKGAVEYIDAWTTKTVTGVELHVRQSQPAGSVSQDAFAIMHLFSAQSLHQHVHMVAPLPLEELTADPNGEALRLAEYYARVNLFVEMRHILVTGGDIRRHRLKSPKKNDGMLKLFGYLEPAAIEGVVRYLREVGYGRNRSIEDRFKIAFVGFWGSDKYDLPDMFGFEHRDIQLEEDLADAPETLDAIQRGMLTREYGISKESLLRWLGKRTPAQTPSALSSAWYNRPWKELFAQAPPTLRKTLTPSLKGQLAERLGRESAELKMLVHDWSRFPLFAENPTLLKSINAKQKTALLRLQRGDDPLATVQDFLWDTGMYDAIGASIGVGRDNPSLWP